MANRKTDKDRVLEQNGARLVGEFRRRLAAAEKTAKAVPQGENVVSLPQAASPFKPAPIEAPAPNRIAQIREIARRAAMGESAEAAQSPYIQWVNGQSDEIFPGGDARLRPRPPIRSRRPPLSPSRLSTHWPKPRPQRLLTPRPCRRPLRLPQSPKASLP